MERFKAAAQWVWKTFRLPLISVAGFILLMSVLLIADNWEYIQSLTWHGQGLGGAIGSRIGKSAFRLRLK